jgi:opacity protein-like surface antigen
MRASYRLRITVLSTLCLGMSVTTMSAQSAGPDGPYVTGRIGASYRQPAEDVAAHNTFDPGWKLNGGAGYRFGTLRVEGEFTLLQNDFKEITLSAGGATLPPEQSEGNARGQSVFGSLYYDFPTGGALRPYVGAGVGSYRVHIDGLTSPTLGSFGIVVDETTGWTRAFQVRAGAAYAVSPSTEIHFGYRWHRGFPLTFTVPGVGELNPGGVRTHNAEIGVRYFFGG